MPQQIRVLLVEDHKLVAEGMAALLGREADLQVVGVAGSSSEAVTMASQTRPHVILMDFHLPDATGAQTAERVRDLTPRPRVVFLSGDEGEDALLAAVHAGGCGFLPKTKASADVVAAVRKAADGEMLIPAAQLAALLVRVRERARDEAERSRLRAQLAPREHEVLLLMAQGFDNKAIATELGLTVNSVRSYVQDILEKLGAHSKLEAVAVAAQHDLLAA